MTMRILQLLTYYRPWISGLTIYVERLSRGLASAGHDVTVLTSHYDKQLPATETMDGVKVVRVPVAYRISKGVIMPGYGNTLRKLLPETDVAHLHLPQFDGAGIAINARLKRVPSLFTIHGDIRLPDLPANKVVQLVINTMNRIAGDNVDRVISYTDDFAKHSRFISRYARKLSIVPPPLEMPAATPADIEAFKREWNLEPGKGPVIGMVARLATEKGVEVLANALEHVLEQRPNARVIFAGPYKDVVGEAEYAARIQTIIERLSAKHGHCWDFTGPVQGAKLAALFASCDVHVLPSLNSTESFGLVQVESMLCGTPVICSDLPGVRVAPQVTGMGTVVPIGDARALANAIIEVTGNRARYVKPRAEIEGHYSTHKTVREYERIYRELMTQRQPAAAPKPSRHPR
jgi:glycosyltransferase involved in cell wall biosynthesis